MSHLRHILCIAVAAVVIGLPAIAAHAGGLDEQQSRFDRLGAHRGRLEQQLAEQTRRVARLKAQPPGVGRDFQLSSALRTSQQLAQRLTELQQRIRSEQHALIEAYEQAIRNAEGNQREVLRQRRARLTRRVDGETRIVTGDRTSPYDSSDDLEERADLLKDSEEKVRRQLRRLQQRLARLHQRARLARHARAADDSPFVESAPRRTSRVQTVRTSGAPTAAVPDSDGATKSAETPADRSQSPTAAFPGASEDDPSAAAPPSTDFNSDVAAPAPTGRGDWSGGGSPAPSPPPPTEPAPGSAAGSTSASVTIQDVVDPGLLRALEQAGTSGDLRARIAALQRAARELDRLASGLSSKAKSLRKRAQDLRQRPR